VRPRILWRRRYKCRPRDCSILYFSLSASAMTKSFFLVHRNFGSQFWNYFLTSGAHTRKTKDSESAKYWLAAPRGEKFTERMRESAGKSKRSKPSRVERKHFQAGRLKQESPRFFVSLWRRRPAGGFLILKRGATPPAPRTFRR
jgi:hypothetical protein